MSHDWMPALLIMDADVIYERDSLRAMTRHLADQKVGAVTGYIQEGSSPGNYMTRCRLGGIGFGAIWFSVFLLPVLLLLSCASLVTLYFVDPQVSHSAFLVLWIVNVIAYVFITCYSLLIDPQAGRRTWRHGILFPGIISLLIMAQVVITAPVQWLIVHALAAIGLPAGPLVLRGETLFSYLWLSGSMAVAYLAKRVERDSRPGRRRARAVRGRNSRRQAARANGGDPVADSVRAGRGDHRDLPVFPLTAAYSSWSRSCPY